MKTKVAVGETRDYFCALGVIKADLFPEGCRAVYFIVNKKYGVVEGICTSMPDAAVYMKQLQDAMDTLSGKNKGAAVAALDAELVDDDDPELA